MILRVHKGQHGQDEYIVCLTEPASLDELRTRMLQNAKVRSGSYASGIIEDLHASIFVRSLDLLADYQKYFAKEYPSFDEYLRRRTRLSPQLARALTAAAVNSSGVYHFRPAYSFLTDQLGLDILTTLTGEPQGEDAE